MEEKGKQRPPSGPWPQLVYWHGKNMEKQTFCSIGKEIGSRCHVCSIPELHDKKVWNCCYGWLILSKHCSPPRHFSIWNPITFENIDLPPMISTYITACILSSAPSDPSCVLILFDFYDSIFWVCKLHHEPTCWSKVAYDAPYFLYSPIYCNGKFYAFTSSWTIVEFTGLRCKPMIPLPRPREKTSLTLSWKLVESCGELYAVTLMYEKLETTEMVLPHGVTHVELHKLDSSMSTWERVVSMKDRSFFVSESFAFSCSSSTLPGIGGNRIYFSLHYEPCLYIYDIQEETITVSLPSPNLHTPWKQPVWIMPDVRLIDSSAEAKVTDEKGDKIQDGVNYISGKLNTLTLKNYEDVSLLSSREASPLLLYFQRNKGHLCFVDPERGERCILEVDHQSLKDATICHCKDGWILMCKNVNPGRFCVNFFNPFTKHVISYPDLLAETLCYLRFGFSSPPTSPDCVVIVLTFARKKNSLDICYSREKGWAHSMLSTNSCYDAQSFKSHIYLNGAFYFLTPSGSIGVLRLLEDKGWEWRVLEEPRKPYLSFCQCFLAEHQGQLLSVFIRDMGKWVCVFKLDSSTMVWNRIRSFGKNTMYISRLSTLLIEANSPQVEDKIYFSRFYGKEVVSYSLRMSKYCHPSATESSSEDYYGTTEPLLCCWIRPS